MKALKITISGSYHVANKDIIDFDKVTGIIPICDEDVAVMHVQRRYAPMWIGADKENYPQRVHNMREVHIDSIEETEHKFSFVGKDIKEMSFEELQDLATFKDLRKIPLYKVGSVQEARRRAYAAYSTEIKGEFMDVNAEDFDYASLPPLKADGKSRRNTSRKMTNDEVLDAESKNVSTKKKPKSTLTLQELKAMAEQKGIDLPPKANYDSIYALLFQQ